MPFNASRLQVSKRQMLMVSGAAGLMPSLSLAATAPLSDRVEPFPLEAVTLKPSIWSKAVDRNAIYLKSLEPDRLLHNFRKSAGLKPKGEVYGGWENMGIAGHSLGHYLTACALMYAQTRDAEFKTRIDYMVTELATIQVAHGDGYVGGTTVERDGKVIDGKVVFEEVRAHKLTTHGFDVNGGWVPLYTWHKVHAGLLDAHRYGDNPQALQVAVKMSDYLIGVIGGLNDEEMQRLLAAEHGGLNETFAETYVRTGEKRFLEMSERIYHKAILTPLLEGRDDLSGKHANTQIPKVIGLARLYEITGKADYRRTAGFFWETVTKRHSYVIGGNADGEHFGKPDDISTRITDKTCEACNSYNMLKLTRHLYGWQPDAGLFDYYERTHLNHIMAHQDPETGMFVYFMPLYAGSQRVYSTPTNSFWCCVGSGIESHAKHGDSIYWRQKDTLFVNLFIPSDLQWTEKKTQVSLTSGFPLDETVTLTITPQKPGTAFEVAVRIPGWCANPSLTLNGEAQVLLPKGGYARLNRRWKAGDKVVLTLPQTVKTESPPDNPRLVAFFKGPMVMAADLGPASTATVPRAPILIGDNGLGLIKPGPSGQALSIPSSLPEAVTLKPFFSQYQQRSAVYFPLFTEAQWAVEQTAYLEAEKARAEDDARTIDVVRLGEMQPERDHGFETDIAEVTSRAGRSGRWIMWTTDKYMAFDIGVGASANVLRVTYWGQDTRKNFDILIDDQVLTREKLTLEPTAAFRTVEYALPTALTKGKSKVRVRFVTKGSDVAVFECRSLRPASGTKSKSA